MAHITYKLKNKVVPSVTTILSRFKNSTGLIIWANNLGLEGKKYHNELNKAANIGSDLHELAQLYIEDSKHDRPLYQKNFYNEALQDPIVLNCFNKFLSWWNEYKQENLEVIFCEKSFISKKFLYGGTADLLIKKNNEYVLVDFKTSKSIYPDYLIQGSAYKQMIEEKYDYKINKFLVARFGKETDDFEIKEFSLDKIKTAFDYFKILRKAFDLDKKLTKLTKESK